MLLLRDCEVDLERREVLRGAEVHALSELEAHLLSYLAARPHEAVSRDQLLVDVWGFPEPVPTRAVDNTLMRLRSRVERDPKRPEHLLSLRGVGICFVPLPATPAPRTRGLLHGRTQELASLGEALARSRLVTLHGPGGIGKTRLALSVEPSCFVALGEARGRSRALAMLADALGIGLPTADADVASVRLGRALAQRDELLVLDEVELLLPELARDIATWLAAAPGLRLLVTSRRTLRLAEEVLVPVGPLAPAAALAMLVERSPVALGDGGAALCARLDHLPLAIELVAPRLASLAPSAVGLDLQAAGAPDLPDRQRTLEAVLRRSWDGLSSAAQVGLGALASAPGSHSSKDALELLGAPAVLDELVSSALLLRRGERYHLLEATRRFAAGTGRGRPRYARWLAERCEADRAELSRDPSALRRLAARLPAVEGQLDSAEPDALRALLAVGPALLVRGPVDGRWVDALSRHLAPEACVLRGALLALLGRAPEAEAAFLQAESGGGATAAEALARRGFLRASAGDPTEGLALAQRAASQARDRGSDEVEALAQVRIGALLHQLGRPEDARRALREALRIQQRRRDEFEEARTLGNLALFDIELGRHDEARPALLRALDHARLTGSRLAELQLSINLGGLAHLEGQLEDAQARMVGALALAGESGDLGAEALCRASLGAIALERGDRDEARRQLGRAAAAFEGAASVFEALALGWLALLEADEGDEQESATLLERARSLAPAAREVLDVLGSGQEPAAALDRHEPAAARSSTVRQALRVARAVSSRRRAR